MSTKFSCPHGIRSGASASQRMSDGAQNRPAGQSGSSAPGPKVPTSRRPTHERCAGYGDPTVGGHRQDDRLSEAGIEATVGARAGDKLTGQDRRVETRGRPVRLGMLAHHRDGKVGDDGKKDHGDDDREGANEAHDPPGPGPYCSITKSQAQNTRGFSPV